MGADGALLAKLLANLIGLVDGPAIPALPLAS
jgi:hypothetical protein